MRSPQAYAHYQGKCINEVNSGLKHHVGPQFKCFHSKGAIEF